MTRRLHPVQLRWKMFKQQYFSPMRIRQWALKCQLLRLSRHGHVEDLAQPMGRAMH